MNRRRFLSSAGLILGAPAIVRAESLMKIWVPSAMDTATILDVLSGSISPDKIASNLNKRFALLDEAHRYVIETAAIYEALRIKDRRSLGAN